MSEEPPPPRKETQVILDIRARMAAKEKEKEKENPTPKVEEPKIEVAAAAPKTRAVQPSRIDAGDLVAKIIEKAEKVKEEERIQETHGSSESAKTTKPKKGKGYFFAVDRKIWDELWHLGPNAMVTYLVLARGSLRDNVTTAWSARSVSERTPISYGRARKAIFLLEKRGLIKVLKGKELQKAVEAAKGTYEPTFLGKIKKGQAPMYRLVLKGELDLIWLPIWLPNAFVDGASGETSPIERLWLSSDVMLIKLCVDFYLIHELTEDGGIARELLHSRFDKAFSDAIYSLHSQETIGKIGEYGNNAVWSISNPPRGSLLDEPTSKYIQTEHEVFRIHLKDGKTDQLEKRIDTLCNLGLLQKVNYILVGDLEEGEPLHAYAEDGETLEVGKIANKAAAALLHLMALNGYARAQAFCPMKYGRYQRPEENSRPFQWNQFVVVPSTYTALSMIVVYRLRYKPNTKKTSKWWYANQQGLAIAEKNYRKILEETEDKIVRCQEAVIRENQAREKWLLEKEIPEDIPKCGNSLK